MRVARWSLPSGLAAIAARMPLGSLVLIDRRLAPNEAQVAAIMAFTRLQIGGLAVLIAYAEVWEAAQFVARL